MFTLSIFVSAGLFPPDTATVFRNPSFAVPPERIVADGLTANIRCSSSIDVNLQFLMDANSIFSMLGIALFRGDLSTPGFYQCASSRTSGSTNLYASEEETVYFLRACKLKCPNTDLNKLVYRPTFNSSFL